MFIPSDGGTAIWFYNKQLVGWPSGARLRNLTWPVPSINLSEANACQLHETLQSLAAMLLKPIFFSFLAKGLKVLAYFRQSDRTDFSVDDLHLSQIKGANVSCACKTSAVLLSVAHKTHTAVRETLELGHKCIFITGCSATAKSIQLMIRKLAVCRMLFKGFLTDSRRGMLSTAVLF